MKSLIHHLFIIIYIILFFYTGNEKNIVLAEIVSCNNAGENCYHLNELLAPCYYKIDFNTIVYINSVGLDTLIFPRCVCSKEFYNSLIACGKTCNFPVDNPIKFESDCKIAKFPVDVDGVDGGGSPPASPKTGGGTPPNAGGGYTPPYTPPYTTPNTDGGGFGGTSNTGLGTGAVASIIGSISGVVIIIGAIIAKTCKSESGSGSNITCQNNKIFCCN